MNDGRSAAFHALLHVVRDGRFLDDALDRALQGRMPARERALARDLAYGVCRFWTRLSAARDLLLDRPLKPRDADLGTAICLGLYQLEYSRIPAHAAVAETVVLVGKRGAWARGLVNAVLRRYAREREAALREVDSDPAVCLSHPRWLLDALRRAWPEHWRSIALANNSHAPMTLRVNRRRIDRERAARRLADAGIATHPGAHGADALVLDEPRDVADIAGFAAGDLSVQDEAAQLAADLLAVQPGQRLLDACAAPGGKLAHLLERTPAMREAVALDRDPTRLRRLEATLARLELRARVACADATEVSSWNPGGSFERVLLDVPCSATGVIRRHPDIKLHRRADDLGRLPRQQYALLRSLWPLLARDGRLLYATCSVMPEENAGPVQRFLSAQADARAVDLDVPWGVPAPPGRQILPGESGMDGFYYALLVKR